MKRIIGMLMAVCFCFGLCMQTSVSEAARWKTVYKSEYSQVQVDEESAQKTFGKYQVWVRTVDNKSGEIKSEYMYDYKVKKDDTSMFVGVKRFVAHVESTSGTIRYSSSSEWQNIYPESSGDAYVLAYLSQRLGKNKIETPNYQWFYSDAYTIHKIELTTIAKYDGVYAAWVERHTASNRQYYMDPYEYTRMEYKKDEQGRLWVRSLYYEATDDADYSPKDWQLAEESEMYPTAEKEFAFIKAYLGEQ